MTLTVDKGNVLARTNNLYVPVGDKGKIGELEITQSLQALAALLSLPTLGTLEGVVQAAQSGAGSPGRVFRVHVTDVTEEYAALEASGKVPAVTNPIGGDALVVGGDA